MNVLKKDPTFLNCFWELASQDGSVRVAASERLSTFLSDDEVAHERNYTTNRLVRGLASSREAARLGFATALTNLLRQDTVELKEVWSVLDKETMITGSMKGEEERDNLFAKLFCCLCVIRSQKIKNQSAELALETAGELLRRLLELHAAKGWLREVTAYACVLLLSSCRRLTEVRMVAAELIARLTPPLSSFAAWQLQLLVLLQNLTYRHDISRRDSNHTITCSNTLIYKMDDSSSAPVEDDEIIMLDSEIERQLIRSDLFVSPLNNLDCFRDTLFACVAGYPKVIS